MQYKILSHMRISTHTRMGYPIHVQDIVLSHTCMGVRYEYTWLHAYSYIAMQQWTIPAWMHRLDACRCYSGMCFPRMCACFSQTQLSHIIIGMHVSLFINCLQVTLIYVSQGNTYIIQLCVSSEFCFPCKIYCHARGVASTSKQGVRNSP